MYCFYFFLDLPDWTGLFSAWTQFFKDAIQWGIDAAKAALLIYSVMYLMKYLFTKN